MVELTVFNFVTLNGFFQGPDGDTSWAHERPTGDYAAEAMKGGSTLLFGRVTYEMMASFWPTPAGAAMAPEVAKGMNRAEKVVFSRSLRKAEWENTRVSANMFDEIARLKAAGKSMTVLGSGSIVTQLAEQGLVDRYEILVHPIALGAGTPMFHGAKKRIDLEVVSTRRLEAGVVALSLR
jgi:dihydrofolate reductase